MNRALHNLFGRAEARERRAAVEAQSRAYFLERGLTAERLDAAVREHGSLDAALSILMREVEAGRRRDGFVTEFAEDAPQWTAEMAEAWRHFLAAHEAGKGLQRLANFHEQQTNRAAVHRTSGAESNAGYARGWHDATAYFFKTLSADPRPQQGTDTQAADDADALRERLAS
jgi:hypothetical protein